MRTLLLSRSVTFSTLLLASITAAMAQTHYYINSISVAPTEPTESDAITISLTGDLSSSGAYIVSAEYMLMDNIVHITMVAADPGGLAVLVPHTEEINIGTLPAGPYGILVDGTAILDMAPEFEHSFNVTGGGDGCADLNIISMAWSPFDDSAVLLHVNNNGASNFDYPTFILLDENNDTLAVETDIQFALVGESWHVLDIHDDATIPEGAFQGTLKLYTGFVENFACEWDEAIDLCPTAECTTVYPVLNNFGDGLAIGTYTWTISDEGGVVTQGQFELTAELQSDQDETCLPPGAYQMTVAFDQEPTGGQLNFGINAEGFVAGPTQNLFFGAPVPMPFDLLAQCADGTNSIDEGEDPAQLVITTMDGAILITDRTGAQLGTVVLYDAVGKEIARKMTNTDRIQFQVAADGMYVLRTSTAAVKVVVERR